MTNEKDEVTNLFAQKIYGGLWKEHLKQQERRELFKQVAIALVRSGQFSLYMPPEEIIKYSGRFTDAILAAADEMEKEQCK